MNTLVANFVASAKVSLVHNVFASNTRHSKHVEQIVQKLQSLGVIASYTVFKKNSTNYINFKLNIINGIPMLHNIVVVSKSGKEVYAKLKELKSYKKGIYFDMLVSTSKGILCYKECVVNNLGGKILLLYT